MKDWKTGVILTLLALVAVLWFGNWRHSRHMEEERARVAQLRTDFLEERARAQGYQAQLTAATRNLHAALIKEAVRGDELAGRVQELVLQVEAAGGRIISLTELLATAQGHLVDTVEVFHDSVTAQVNDGLLEGSWVYRPEQSLFDLTYLARVPLDILQSETPDRRLLTTVRSPDPRVSPQVQDVYFQLPGPVRYCPMGTRAKAAGVGGVVGILLWELAKSAAGG